MSQGPCHMSEGPMSQGLMAGAEARSALGPRGGRQPEALYTATTPEPAPPHRLRKLRVRVLRLVELSSQRCAYVCGCITTAAAAPHSGGKPHAHALSRFKRPATEVQATCCRGTRELPQRHVPAAHAEGRIDLLHLHGAVFLLTVRSRCAPSRACAPRRANTHHALSRGGGPKATNLRAVFGFDLAANSRASKRGLGGAWRPVAGPALSRPPPDWQSQQLPLPRPIHAPLPPPSHFPSSACLHPRRCT